MIKFFRKIRQNLLNEGKTTKYFKYAIGEILLVVIGILIALQINNWNEERKDRIREQKILVELKNIFKSNIAQLENKISLRKNIIKEASEVLTFIDLQKKVPIDTLVSKISSIILAPTFDPIENELMTAENLQLIQNDSLRHYLSNFSSGITDLKEQEDEWKDMYNNIIVEFLIDLGISRDILISFYEDSTNLNFMLDKSTVKEMNLKKSGKLPSVESILNNIKLEGILANAVLVNLGVNWESEGYLKQMQKILKRIENEIK